MLGTLQNIRFFVAAYEERSFTGAATREHATQPGVSHHVKHLEDMLGAQLFIRDKGKLLPTPAGDTYYHYCIKVMLAYDESINAMREYSDTAAESLTIGVIPALTRNLTGPVLSKFMSEWPNVAIRVVEAYTPAIVDGIMSGEFDIGFTSKFNPRDGLHAHHLFDSTEYLVSAKQSNQITGDGDIELKNVVPIKLIRPLVNNAHRDVIDSYFREHDIQLAGAVEIDSILATLDLVSNSDWFAILPSLMLRKEDEKKFRLQRIVNPIIPFKIYQLNNITRALSPAAKAFITQLNLVATEFIHET